MIGKRIRRNSRKPRGTLTALQIAACVLARYITDAHHDRGRDGAVRSLLHYIRDQHESGHAAGEKVAWTGTINLLGESLAEWEAQLVAAASQCRRGRDPVEHYVLSWPENERPTKEQCEQAVRLMLTRLGLQNCPVLWGAHSNTENFHVHVQVVRFDLHSGRMARMGWDIDALHQAVAEIEHLQGWSSEPGAIFLVQDNCIVERETGEIVRHLGRDASALPRSRRKRAETDSDPEALRIKAQIHMVLAAAQSWDDFHTGLDRDGLRYDKKGYGAAITSGSQKWKASKICRELSRPNLEKKLGPFKAAPSLATDAYEQYLRTYREELARLRMAEAEARERLDEGRRRNRAEVAKVLEDKQADLLRAAINKQIDAETAAARKAIGEEFKRTKKRLAESRLERQAWEQMGRPPSVEARPLPAIYFPSLEVELERPLLPKLPVRHLDRDGQAGFTDHGAAIIVHVLDRDAIAAALLRASSKWGAVRASGSAEFLSSSQAIAAELGISLTFAGPISPEVSADQTRDSRDLEALPEPENPLISKAEELLIQIEKNLMLIEQDERRPDLLKVAKLNPEDQLTLDHDTVTAYVQKRLATIKNEQDKQVEKLAEWLDTYGQDPSRVTYNGRRVIPIDVPKDIYPLLQCLRPHPAIRSRLETGSHAQDVAKVLAWLEENIERREKLSFKGGTAVLSDPDKSLLEAFERVKEDAGICYYLTIARHRRMRQELMEAPKRSEESINRPQPDKPEQSSRQVRERPDSRQHDYELPPIIPDRGWER